MMLLKFARKESKWMSSEKYGLGDKIPAAVQEGQSFQREAELLSR